MSEISGESSRRPITIERITVTGEFSDGEVQLGVEFGHVKFARNALPFAPARDEEPGVAEISWFAHQLRQQVEHAIDDSRSGALGSTLNVAVSRDQIEQSVRAIRVAVADFNLTYPSLLADHQREVEQREAENAPRQERLEADQRSIDRVIGNLNETSQAESEKETDRRNIIIETIKAEAEHDDGSIQLGVELRNAFFMGDPRQGISVRDKWFNHRFMLACRAVGINGGGRSGSTIHVSTHRDALEETVGKIRTAIAEFNHSYPALDAEYEVHAENNRAESAAKKQRLDADQQLIDRLTAPHLTRTLDIQSVKETDWANVTVNTITATAEYEGKIWLRVEFGNADFGGLPDKRRRVISPRDRWFTDRFSLALRQEGVGPSTFGESTLSFSVRRDALEETVRRIHTVVDAFAESYPLLLAKYGPDDKGAEDAAKRDRLEASQRLIDRVMNERPRAAGI